MVHGSAGYLNPNFIRFLLCDASADVNAVDKQGRTALHYAAEYDPYYRSWGSEVVAILLICHGASLYAKDLNQQTARDLAGDSLGYFLKRAEKAQKDEVKVPEATESQQRDLVPRDDIPPYPVMGDTPVSWQICSKHCRPWEKWLWRWHS
jgi:hypothetical protein